MSRPRKGTARLSLVAATGVVALTTAMISVSSAGAAPRNSTLAAGVHTSSHSLKAASAKAAPRSVKGNNGTRPAGLPAHGRSAFLLKLSTSSTHTAYAQARGGKQAARSAATSQLRTVTAAQNHVIAASAERVAGPLPCPRGAGRRGRHHRRDELPRPHPPLRRERGLPDRAEVAEQRLRRAAPGRARGMAGVRRPRSRQHASRSSTPAWTTRTPTSVASAPSRSSTTPRPSSASPSRPASSPAPRSSAATTWSVTTTRPTPTPRTSTPCRRPTSGRSTATATASHVAGTVGGYGENADGSTYTGAYDASTPFDTMKIGPGMAPEGQALRLPRLRVRGQHRRRGRGHRHGRRPQRRR